MRPSLVACAALLASATTVSAQQSSDMLNTLAGWVTLAAPAGWEHVAAPTLDRLPGWSRDGAGNWIARRGSGAPRRVIACNIDQPGYVISQIGANGWLRVHSAGNAPLHPLWHQFHEGQRVRVITRAGPVPGVFATPSTHLRRGRAADSDPVTTDDLWLDVGVASAAEVQALGIELLDPVQREWPAWTYAEHVAGPFAAQRVGCASLAAAAQGTPMRGETVFVLGLQGSFGNAGIGAALARLGRVDQLTVVRGGAPADARELRQVRSAAPSWVPESAGIDSLETITFPVRYAGALIESVAAATATALLRVIATAAAVPEASAGWVALVPPAPGRAAPPVDPHTDLARTLATLADLPGVSGDESAVRTAIHAALPAAARSAAQVDQAGNLIVAFGPDRDTTVFIAHMDETGYEIVSVAEDGTVALRTRGGMIPSLWQGQPALLYVRDAAPLRGVFETPSASTTGVPPRMTAWFGLDANALSRAGVRPGQTVTAYKSATRIGPHRFTARALDDRAGSTALLLALARIDARALTRKIIFVWSVREETGLEGAQAIANRLRTSVRRVYSIDTFVSSDSPIETDRFAFAPLGAGPIHRALDNASITTPAETDRIARIARAAGIQLQRGTTNGGTDGSAFIRFGALQAGLSWPGRYSHSPVEVLDLRDLRRLADLIAALAVSPE